MTVPDASTSRAYNQAQSLSVVRMMGLTTAAVMLGGQDKLADALGIQPRSLRAKLAGERGVSNADLLAVADAIDTRIGRLADHARKLREEAAAATPENHQAVA